MLDNLMKGVLFHQKLYKVNKIKFNGKHVIYIKVYI